MAARRGELGLLHGHFAAEAGALRKAVRYSILRALPDLRQSKSPDEVARALCAVVDTAIELEARDSFAVAVLVIERLLASGPPGLLVDHNLLDGRRAVLEAHDTLDLALPSPDFSTENVAGFRTSSRSRRSSSKVSPPDSFRRSSSSPPGSFRRSSSTSFPSQQADNSAASTLTRRATRLLNKQILGDANETVKSRKGSAIGPGMQGSAGTALQGEQQPPSSVRQPTALTAVAPDSQGAAGASKQSEQQPSNDTHQVLAKARVQDEQQPTTKPTIEGRRPSIVTFAPDPASTPSWDDAPSSTPKTDSGYATASRSSGTGFLQGAWPWSSSRSSNSQEKVHPQPPPPEALSPAPSPSPPEASDATKAEATTKADGQATTAPPTAAAAAPAATTEVASEAMARHTRARGTSISFTQSHCWVQCDDWCEMPFEPRLCGRTHAHRVFGGRVVLTAENGASFPWAHPCRVSSKRGSAR
jgi:hypothetical protein